MQDKGYAPAASGAAGTLECVGIVPARPFDQEATGPAARGSRTRPDIWDWPATDGALALDWEEPPPRPPHSRSHLREVATSGSLPRMAGPPQGRGLAARAAVRERERAKARRARRFAALVAVGSIALVVLLLTAFGTGEPAALSTTGPAPAQRLLPSGPPRPQMIATHDTLRIQLPINEGRVTAIGYHGAGDAVVELEPLGTQANAGLFGRLVQRLIGGDGSGLRYYLLEGGSGEPTGGLDVGAPVDTDVYAPVDGTVISITDRIVDGRVYGKRIEIQPSGNSGLVVALTNLSVDPVLSVGTPLLAGRTKLGRVVDVTPVERAALARYTQDQGQHVHLEVLPAASLATP